MVNYCNHLKLMEHLVLLRYLSNTLYITEPKFSGFHSSEMSRSLGS